MKMTDTLHNAPIVLDNGSGTIRAGFAGEDLPKCYFPSFVGRPKHLRVLAGALEGDVFIGQRAQELRGLLKIRYPLEHGIVTDWDDMERIWEWVYGEGLKTLSEDVSSFLSFEGGRRKRQDGYRNKISKGEGEWEMDKGWFANSTVCSIPFSSRNHLSTPAATGTLPPRSSSKPSMFPPSTHPYKLFSPSTPLAAQQG